MVELTRSSTAMRKSLLPPLRGAKTLVLVAALALSMGLSACGSADDDVGQEASSSLAFARGRSERDRGSRYPIVLHHGFLGFDRIFFIEYFYGVRKALERDGFVVRETRVSPVNTIEHRAQALRRQVDAVLAETGAAKVNVIAHSMGGLDTRYLISSLGYGDRIASVTMMGTPNKGTVLADVALGFVAGGADAALEAFLQLALPPSARKGEDGGDFEFDVAGALRDLSERYQQTEFGPANPMDPRVVYESYEGRSSWLGVGGGGRIDPLLAAPFGVLRALRGENDGLVTLESARYGTSRGVLPGDHIDLIGQLLGRTSYNHIDFYRGVARGLRARGF